jgi:hypothetical protein
MLALAIGRRRTAGDGNAPISSYPPELGVPFMATRARALTFLPVRSQAYRRVVPQSGSAIASARLRSMTSHHARIGGGRRMSTLGWPLRPPQERGVERGVQLLQAHGIEVPRQEVERQTGEVLARLAGDLVGVSALAEETLTMNLALGIGAHLSSGEPFPMEAAMGLRDILKRIFDGLW